ncbi:zinc finger protein ZAT9-like [Cynara cardunculus var. scolymus]|uniref:zinc finger protein ZAT9-like n=1 Tax=Cynara cardunculus var. scolymus TaxID=59895 RepID=UPI000D62E262|nr:zinc finger protein ZAT9-like [Cynara cardunculus var. scolymus]
MEEFDQESMKHICKFCNKSFPCGRSLGGHIRSHVINSPDHHHHQKLSSFINNGGLMNNNNNNNVIPINGSSNSNDSCYELRKDPKKTIKSKDSRSSNQVSSSSVLDKLCKECGKGFQSWKALFGHMKCHSKKVSNNKNNNSASLNHNSLTSQSDNENSDAKIHRIKRSRSRNRRNKRYSPAKKTAITTASSSISMNNNNQISSNNASTSVVSEIDQEQEADVAMSLMMLSKDVRKWGNQFGSSDYCSSSVLGKNLFENGFKMKKSAETQVGIDFLGRSEVDYEGFERISTKNDEFTSCFAEIKDSNKRKFECFSCNKSFHSYQALGGHKASHKKLKICFDSRPLNENTIEHEPVLDHDQTINGYDQKTSGDHQEPSNFNLGHECSVCLKMFSSGQALGGHKRSHVIAESKPNQENYTNVIKKPDEQPIRETRTFLDLNMPPQEEEEEEEMIMKSSCTIKYKSYYWEDCSDHHNHESRLLGLLSTS